MSGGIKFVALALSVALLAVPASALEACWSMPGQASHSCCANMESEAPAADVQAAGNGRSCCDLSSGKPVPSPKVTVPVGADATLLPPETTATLVVVLLRANNAPPGAAPPLPESSLQPVLCTFLI